MSTPKNPKVTTETRVVKKRVPPKASSEHKKPDVDIAALTAEIRKSKISPINSPGLNELLEEKIPVEENPAPPPLITNPLPKESRPLSPRDETPILVKGKVLKKITPIEIPQEEEPEAEVKVIKSPKKKVEDEAEVKVKNPKKRVED